MVAVISCRRAASTSMSALPLVPMARALRRRSPAVLMLASSSALRSEINPASLRTKINWLASVLLPTTRDRPTPAAPANSMLPVDCKVLPSLMVNEPCAVSMSTRPALMLPLKLKLAVVALSLSKPPTAQLSLLVPSSTVRRALPLSSVTMAR